MLMPATLPNYRIYIVQGQSFLCTRPLRPTTGSKHLNHQYHNHSLLSCSWHHLVTKLNRPHTMTSINSVIFPVSMLLGQSFEIKACLNLSIIHSTVIILSHCCWERIAVNFNSCRFILHIYCIKKQIYFDNFI